MSPSLEGSRGGFPRRSAWAQAELTNGTSDLESCRGTSWPPETHLPAFPWCPELVWTTKEQTEIYDCLILGEMKIQVRKYNRHP